jgi:hypothetical protein
MITESAKIAPRNLTCPRKCLPWIITIAFKCYAVVRCRSHRESNTEFTTISGCNGLVPD